MQKNDKPEEHYKNNNMMMTMLNNIDNAENYGN